MPKSTLIVGSAGSGKTLVSNVLALYKTRLTNNKVIFAHDINEGLSMWETFFDDTYKKNLIIINSYDNGGFILDKIKQIKPKVVVVDNVGSLYFNFTVNRFGKAAKSKLTDFINVCNDYGADVIMTQPLVRSPNNMHLEDFPQSSFLYDLKIKPKKYKVTRIIDKDICKFYLNETGRDPSYICSIDTSKPKLIL